MAGDAVGRRQDARGTRRKALMLEAGADLLCERGFGHLSHRAVAERARVPLGATTYYFSSREDLLHQAFAQLAQRWLARATAAVRELPAVLDPAGAAAAVVAVVTATAAVPRRADPGNDPDPGRDRGTGVDDLLAMYERYLEAGRHAALRPVVAAYDSALADLVDDVVRRTGTPADGPPSRLLMAVVDGTVVGALAHGSPTAQAAEAAARHVLALLPSAPSAPSASSAPSAPSVRAAPADLT